MKRFLSLFLLLFLVSGLSVFAQETQEAPAQQAPEAPAQQAPEAQEQEKEKAWSKTIQLKEEDTLTVYVDPGNVKIMPWDKKEVFMTVEGLKKSEYPRIQVTNKNKNIKLDYRGDKSITGTFVVQLPKAFNLDVYTSSDLEITGAIEGKKLKFSNTTGTILAGDFTGNVIIDSTGGDISIGAVTGNLQVSTNGDIETQDVSGDLELRNQSGDSFVRNIGGNANAKSADGDISLGEVGGSVTIASTIGDVELRKGTSMSSLNTDSGDIDVFEAGGMVIAATTSGDITLRKISGAVDAKADDGDVSAELFAGSGGSSKLYSREGDVMIYFPDNAKATVEAKVRGGDEEEEPIESDWRSEKTEKQGQDLISKFEINGGGDSILAETSGGEIMIKKIVPKPAPKTAQPTPQQ